MKVSIFARAMRVDGVDYPQGSLYPTNLLKPPKEEQLRRNRMITEIEFEEVFGLLERGATAPDIVLDLVADLMAERERDLDLLDEYLERLTVSDVADEVEIEEVEVEVVVDVEVVEETDEVEENDDEATEEAADETPDEVEDNPEDEKSEGNLIGNLLQKFPFTE